MRFLPPLYEERDLCVELTKRVGRLGLTEGRLAPPSQPAYLTLKRRRLIEMNVTTL